MRKILIPLLFVVFPLAAQAGEPQVVAHWTQLGPDGVETRAVVEGDVCPRVTAHHQVLEMQVRAPASQNFPLVCGVRVPGRVKQDLQEGREQAPGEAAPGVQVVKAVLPPTYPARVVVFGDTGCRIKGLVVQDCNDPAKWPFPRIAAEAARLKPDLVIHVGDYLYRERACPEGFAGCTGTPHGDNWQTWNADFFAPAKPLLAAAPWVFVRGNHEDCDRAGPGWLRLLGPLPYDPAAACVAHLAPYSVQLGSVNLVVMDDVNAPDESVVGDMVPVYRREIADLRNEPTPSWLLMHRPIWAAVSGPLGLPVGGNQTMIAAAADKGIPSSVTLMLAGHIHSFEAINYRRPDHVPPQIVAGFGGDKLDPVPSRLKGAIFQGDSGVVVTDGLSLPGFGFLMMTKTRGGWTIDVHDVRGRIERQCLFHAGRVDCPPSP